MEDDLSFLDKKTLNLVISAIKKSFTQNSLEYQLILNKSAIREGPRNGNRWICNICKVRNLKPDINVDHIFPCIPLDKSASSMSLQEIYTRTFTTSDNLQVLCKPCHKLKTKKESDIRKGFRKLSKPQKISPKKKREK